MFGIATKYTNSGMRNAENSFAHHLKLDLQALGKQIETLTESTIREGERQLQLALRHLGDLHIQSWVQRAYEIYCAAPDPRRKNFCTPLSQVLVMSGLRMLPSSRPGSSLAPRATWKCWQRYIMCSLTRYCRYGHA
jgi:hypothetical protein